MKMLEIDTRAMADEMGLELVDVVRDGKVIMRDHVWTKEALLQAVAQTRARYEAEGKDADKVALMGHCASWVAGALAYVCMPTPIHFEIGPGGVFKMDTAGFPIDEKGSEVLGFQVREDGDKVFVEAVSTDPHGDAHGFDMKRFDEIVMPPIPAGKHVFLSGEVVNPIVVGMVLTYRDAARSVSIRFHREPDYVCAISHCDELGVGDRTGAEG